MATPETPVRTADAPKGGFIQYLNDVAAELKKAQWPTKEELLRMTQIVLVLIAIVAAYCGLLDALFALITKPIFTRG